VNKVKGNHVIMVTVEVPETIRRAAELWCIAGNGRKMKEEFHVTLFFVGKDLSKEHAEQVLLAGQWAATEVGERVMLEGGRPFMFGGKKDHVVLKIMQVDWMTRIRQTVSSQLLAAGLSVRADYSFNPHVTLATGAPNDTKPEFMVTPQVLRVTGVEVKVGDGDRRKFANVVEGL
jgi:2'-5' RNA ligase